MTLILFILMLGLLISIHEAGHMLVAKMFNMYVREYSIGFGPVIWKKQGKETLYSIRAIPLGGFTGLIESENDNVAQKYLEGSATEEKDVTEEETEEEPQLLVDESRTFYGAKPWKRILVLLAGPVANLLLACIVFVSIFIANGKDVIYPKAVIQQVMPQSAAMEAGLQPGDEIVQIRYSNGDVVKVETTYDVSLNNQMHKGEMTVTVIRNNNSMDVSLTPRYDEESKAYMMGIMFSGQPEYRKLNLVQAIGRGISFTFETISLTLKSVAMLITGQVGMESMAGTIGIYSITKEAVSYGFLTYLSLVGQISVSLGIMNLLPVPVFDGGRILLTLIEMIIGHRLSRKMEDAILTVGLVLVLLLFILITVSDISKLFN